MAEFSYIARDEKGYRQTGNISSENYNTAVDKLQNDGLTIVKLTERDASFDFIKPFINRLSLEIETFKNKVPLNVLVFFTRQISTMFSAGLTIERALYFLSEEEKNKKFKKVLIKVAGDVKKGLLLSDALKLIDKLESSFPDCTGKSTTTGASFCGATVTSNEVEAE